MIRRLALLGAFLAAGFTPVLAQTQTRTHPSHPQGKPHDPAGHMPLDPALHAAIHARLMGNWSGTLTAADAAPTELQLDIASDKQGQMTVKMTTDRSMKAGSASEVAIDGHGLHWTQALSGTPCKVTAVLEATTHHAPETMKGTMACGRQEVTFTLQKTQG